MPTHSVSWQEYEYTYTMLESKVFFEPYKVVLKALQTMSDSNFPMKSYMVDAEKTSKLPIYLKDKNFFSDKIPDWLVSRRKKLNESQYMALRHALEEELAVIQGPPGTGKTFVALEIVNALLTYKDLWLNHGPIMIVCHTNHALDQFLEGMFVIF